MSKTLRDVPFDLSTDAREQSVGTLQTWLPCLIAGALRLKQAHWNLRGMRFKSVHEQLDEILEDHRTAIDDVAERIATLGGAADGLPQTVASTNALGSFPAGLLTVEQAITTICEDLAVTVREGRKCISSLGEVDPVSQDLAIAIVGTIEKHHWMLHSQNEL